MSALEKGIICEFVEKQYQLSVDASPDEYSDYPAADTVKCKPNLYHSTNVENSYWSVTFSFPILVYSYSVYSMERYHTLTNWILYQKDPNTAKWINSSQLQNFSTINNTYKFVIQKPIKTQSLKLVGGLDRDGIHYFLKFHQIEFYGKIFITKTCLTKIHLYHHIILMLLLILS